MLRSYEWSQLLTVASLTVPTNNRSEANVRQYPHLQLLPTTEVKPMPYSSLTHSSYQQQKWSQRLTVASPTAPVNIRSEANAWQQPHLQILSISGVKPMPESSLTYSSCQYQKWSQCLTVASPTAPVNIRSEANAWQQPHLQLRANHCLHTPPLFVLR